MTIEDQVYYQRRAPQEDIAGKNANSEIVRARNKEMAALYRPHYYELAACAAAGAWRIGDAHNLRKPVSPSQHDL